MPDDQSHPRLSDVVASLPDTGESRMASIREKLSRRDCTTVVLDDDPTGTQTVYDVPVLTEWSRESIVAEFENRTPLFFLLTNSRSVPKEDACDIARSIGSVLGQASDETGRDFEVISRSDSTLRGHFPAEVDALAKEIGQEELPTLLIPYFAEGNRFTVGGIHYVVDGDEMIPAAETPFAKDTAFGYSNSNLKDWVEEKTGGRVRRDDVQVISVEQIRSDPESVGETLRGLPPRSVCVIDSLDMKDQEVFVDQLLSACEDGCRFLYRTAASFVQVIAGLESKSLLTRTQMNGEKEGGGLIVVGSYVPKTTSQLQQLLSGAPELRQIELDVEQIVGSNRDELVTEATSDINDAIESGEDVVLFTSRQYNSTGSAAGDLEKGKRVSEAVVEIVSSIRAQPRYVIAKGGITSSDIATKALGVCRAMVMGQILPGVPVWRLGSEARYPSMGYVVFPGNVGDEKALLNAYLRLAGEEED